MDEQIITTAVASATGASKPASSSLSPTVDYSRHTDDELHRATVAGIATYTQKRETADVYAYDVLIPAINQIIERYRQPGRAAPYRLDGKPTVGEYFRSVGLNYNNVRSWKLRAHERLKQAAEDAGTRPSKKTHKAKPPELNFGDGESAILARAGVELARAASTDTILPEERDLRIRQIAREILGAAEDGEFGALQEPAAECPARDSMPEPDSGSMEDLRQQLLRMPDTNDMQTVLLEHVHETYDFRSDGLVTKFVVDVRRAGKSRVAVGDFVEVLRPGKQMQLGHVSGVTEGRQPRVRWFTLQKPGGNEWTTPTCAYPDEVGKMHVLNIDEAREKYPEAIERWSSRGKASKSSAAVEKLEAEAQSA
jgi:transposase-like protein